LNGAGGPFAFYIEQKGFLIREQLSFNLQAKKYGISSTKDIEG
jgi:hypothetical protein